MTKEQQSEVRALARAMRDRSEAMRRYQANQARASYRPRSRQSDNGPSFTMLLVAGIGSVMAGVWLAVVLAGAFGLH